MPSRVSFPTEIKSAKSRTKLSGPRSIFASDTNFQTGGSQSHSVELPFVAEYWYLRYSDLLSKLARSGIAYRTPTFTLTGE